MTNGEAIEPLGRRSDRALEEVPSKAVRTTVPERTTPREGGESGAANEQGVSGRDNERDVAARELGSREGETPLSAKRRGRSKPGREPGQLSGSNQSGNDYRTTEADQIEKAAHRGNTLRNAQWRSQPTKTGEDGYGDAGVSRDTGDWSNDLASQGYSVPEVPWRVLKLPQRLFEVGEWIDLIGVALRSIR